MDNEDVLILAQLIQTMKELAFQLEEDYVDKNIEKLNKTKKEILEIQKKIDKIL